MAAFAIIATFAVAIVEVVACTAHALAAAIAIAVLAIFTAFAAFAAAADVGVTVAHAFAVARTKAFTAAAIVCTCVARAFAAVADVCNCVARAFAAAADVCTCAARVATIADESIIDRAEMKKRKYAAKLAASVSAAAKVASANTAANASALYVDIILAETEAAKKAHTIARNLHNTLQRECKAMSCEIDEYTEAMRQTLRECAAADIASQRLSYAYAQSIRALREARILVKLFDEEVETKAYVASLPPLEEEWTTEEWIAYDAFLSSRS